MVSACEIAEDVGVESAFVERRKMYKNFFLFCCNKINYAPSVCIINKSTLSKKYLFLKPASGSENNQEFIACIGIGTRIVIGILMRYQDSYRNRFHYYCSHNYPYSKP